MQFIAVDRGIKKFEKVSMYSLKCKGISSYGQKRRAKKKHFFLKTAHWYGLNVFR